MSAEGHVADAQGVRLGRNTTTIGDRVSDPVTSRFDQKYLLTIHPSLGCAVSRVTYL
jgi:hypothetical protein